jgi:4-hydroxy-tetrahydrodipicolinate synthase
MDSPSRPRAKLGFSGDVGGRNLAADPGGPVPSDDFRGANQVATDFRGVFSAMATPFGADGEIDEAKLRASVDRAVEAGVDGLAPCGSTGEFTAMSDDERKRVVELTVAAAHGRIPVLAQTGALTTKLAVEHSRHAAEAGAAGVFAIPPFYDPLELDDIRGYYEAIADAVDVPVGIYNLPGGSGVDLDPDWVGNLAREVEPISFIKDSTGSFPQIARLAADHGDVLSVLNGDDALLLPSLIAGAHGSLIGALNLVPAECATVYDAYLAGNLEEAEETYLRILPVLRFLVAGHYYSAGVKASLDILGFPAGNPRLPVLPLGGERLEALKGILGAISPAGAAA